MLVALLPLISVVVNGLGAGTGQPGPAAADLWRYAGNTAALAFGVALLSGGIGSVCAWLVVMYRFPGRGILTWALALPLTLPAFAMAYGYADFLDVAGPVQSALRDSFGLETRFSVRNLPGAILILSLAFYPYVYLTLRAAFISQSVCALEAARTLGCSPWAVFARVALPLARPALAAGAALAVMETLADYGAVSFLSVQTLTTGVVRAWSVYGSAAQAAQLSLGLLLAAALLLWIERAQRQGQGFSGGSVRWRSLQTLPLGPVGQGLALLFCLGVLSLALFIPIGWLGVLALSSIPEWPRLTEAFATTALLGLAGALLTLALAALIAFGARRLPWVARVISLGYATPGAVMAIGLLAPAGWIWQGFSGAVSGLGIGLGLLLLAYAARLMAAALEPLEAGLTRITPSMTRAARTLGETETGTSRRVELPLIRGAVLTALLLALIDVIKELPATLILRPFGVETLATLADRFAADERLAQAAWPSLLIIALSLVPVLVLSRQITRSRPGAS